MKWLALDIGGANLKISDGASFADTCAFPMWKRKDELAQELRKLIAESPMSEHLAVTMTGELADCFESKEEGVVFILNAVEEAAASRHARCYLNDGRVVTFQVAKRMAAAAAASNWHALAAYAGRFAPRGSALVIDVGSTTCDIVPLLDGKTASDSRTDTQRLLRRQLLYTGIDRSPVCAFVQQVPYRNQQCPLAQELFATMLDVYLILGDVSEDRTFRETADGREATKAAARARLGRMICADASEFNHRDAVIMAQAVADAQLRLLSDAVRVVRDEAAQPVETVILAGQGEFLALRALKALNFAPKLVILSRELGLIASRTATAYALAALMNEAQRG